MTAERSAVLAGTRLDGLELLLDGMFGDIQGYYLPGEGSERSRLAPRIKVDVPDLAPGDVLMLEDPDRTPVARLDITGVQHAGSSGTWLAGSIARLRPNEQGIARERRLSKNVTLAGRRVCLFDERIRAADVLRALDSADARPVDFVLAARSDSAAAARALDDLTECARRFEDSRVWFLPLADIGTEEDVTRHVVESLGASNLCDFRTSDSAQTGVVVLFTGLSGSGKSTLARALVESLHLQHGQPTVLLDGDDVRREIAGELGFGRADRDRNLQRIAWVAARVAQVGGVAVCAPIAPFEASRAAMRAKVEPDSRFFVVYVSTPLAVAESRDRKGLYAKARRGLIPDFTGIDSPYEKPADADVTVDTSVLTVDQCVEAVMMEMRRQGLLGRD